MKLLASLALLLGLATAQADTFYVPNTGENSVSRYDANGNATNLTSENLPAPLGIALDRAGNVYIGTSANRIEKFSSAGDDLGTFASIGLNFPMALAFDSAGNLYAANFGGSTVVMFTPDGVGRVFANITRPTGLAFDAEGNLYVSSLSNTIMRYDPDGTFLGIFAFAGLNNPEGLVFDSLGNLYVANSGTDSVEKYSAEGAHLGAVAQNIGSPLGLALDSSGNLYVVASRDGTIVKITETGSSVFAQTGFMPGFIAVQTPPTLLNISTRLNVGTGENVLDSGFIIRGEGTKTILIRGLGPSLGQAGVANPLADPMLELHDQTGAILATNDNWKATQEAAIEATGIPPSNDAEAALIVTVNAGTYTVIESGTKNSTGVGLMEIYDLTTTLGVDLANLSTRGFVGTEGDVMIAGLIIGSTTGGESDLIVRALGPSLGAAGVSNPLADPILTLYDSNGMIIATNDDWQTTQAAAIQATGVPPTDPVEAAIVATLAPGLYSAIESGKNGGTGLGLIEIYNLN
jgi:sugar lactone lactonase YvrE